MTLEGAGVRVEVLTPDCTLTCEVLYQVVSVLAKHKIIRGKHDLPESMRRQKITGPPYYSRREAILNALNMFQATVCRKFMKS